MGNNGLRNIGVVGNGFVGSAVAFGFSHLTGCEANVRVYDKDKSRSSAELSDVVNESDFIFVSVPTPANDDGSVNIDIVEDVFSEMNELNTSKNNIFLLRSTVVPGTTRKIQEDCPNLNIVFNPEFLTEKSAKFDFINPSRFILGGFQKVLDYHTIKVGDLLKWRFGPSVPIIKTDYETAEFVKYMTNCYFATKVSFLNEMNQIANECGVNWDAAIDGFSRDGRVGHSHLSVPGPDGKYGFGGSCFPKDIQAMISFAKTLGVEPTVLEGTWNKNLEVRPSDT